VTDDLGREPVPRVGAGRDGQDLHAVSLARHNACAPGAVNLPMPSRSLQTRESSVDQCPAGAPPEKRRGHRCEQAQPWRELPSAASCCGPDGTDFLAL
jgi:hypothetical protein